MLFSIIIPTYNRSNFIISTIQSVLSQTYPNFEIIVVDDGSIDDTEDVLKKILDRRVSYYKKNNEERAAARNYGISKAKGDYITFLDSDDILLPHYLQEAISLIQKNNIPPWFHLRYKITNNSNVIIWQSESTKNGNSNKLLLEGNFLSCIGVFLREDIAKENKFNEIRALSGSEDHELWLRIAARYPLKTNNVLTAALIDHIGRSVVNIDKDLIVKRQNIFIELILSNPSLKSFVYDYERQLKSNSYSYVSLHLALSGKHKKVCLTYLIKAIKENYIIVFNRRFLAIIKHLLFTY
jgi:glycosyltransferase involved in cell wall biosynthesis